MYCQLLEIFIILISC